MIKMSEKGETMVEAIIALAVVVAIATGIVVAVVTALSGSNFNQNSNFALNYAQEAQDVVKDLASSDFATFAATYPGGVSYCMSDNNTLDSAVSTNCPANTANIDNTFLRTIYINQSGNNPSGVSKCASTVYVASFVAWTDSKCKTGSFCHKVELDSCVANLNSLSTP